MSHNLANYPVFGKFYFMMLLTSCPQMCHHPDIVRQPVGLGVLRLA